MPDLSKAEVERRLAPGFGFGWMSSGEQEALQTALSLYARVEAAEQERDGWRDEALVLREGMAKVAPYLVVHGWETDDFWPAAPLTTAAAERWKAMERVCEAARGLVWLTGRCPIEYDTDIPSRVRDELTALNASLAALASLGKEGE